VVSGFVHSLFHRLDCQLNPDLELVQRRETTMNTVFLRLSESLFRTSLKRGAEMAANKGDRIEERVYKSLWHVAIASVGIYELKHHKSTISKILATGLIAFHMDAAIADALDIPPLTRRILDYVRPEVDAKPKPKSR